MSNIYIQEPPALGKVLLKTTVGDIDLELWTKEAPKACRNFIQLCMEGYYNGTIFHRVVPDFIVQGGDPNGDGTGGESVYGATFKDEFHSRLRFNRRGLVAMANAGKDDNGSQFFFTLNATPELQNKHTIFAKVTGETVFNMMKLSEVLTDQDDRPLYPTTIVETQVLIDPFGDIVPRCKPVSEKTEDKKKKKDRTGVKNFGLLSFGEEAEEEEDDSTEFRGKPKSTHDLLDDPKLSRLTAQDINPEEPASSSKDQPPSESTKAAVSSIRDKLQAKKSSKKDTKPSSSKENGGAENDGAKSEEEIEEYYLGKDRIEARKKQAESIRQEIRDLKREMSGKKKEVVTEAEEPKKEEPENNMVKDYEEEQEKYRKKKEQLPGKGQSRGPHNTSEEKEKKPWVKNLYENTGHYKDNYTDVKFLEQMRKNVHPQNVTFFESFLGSCRVTQKLSTCVIFCVLFTYLYNEWLSTKIVFGSSCAITASGYIIYLIARYVNTRKVASNVESTTKVVMEHNLQNEKGSGEKYSYINSEEAYVNSILENSIESYLRRQAKKDDKDIKSNFKNSEFAKKKLLTFSEKEDSITFHIFSHLKTVLIFLVFGLIVSPILHTLTDTVSTDTIFATTAIMMIVHLIFSDYGISVAVVSNSLSINAAIFGSICLASRLGTSFHAFVLITLAVQCFVLFPILINMVLNSRCAIFVFTSTTVCAFISLWFVSKTMFCIFLVSVVFLNVYCPVLFVRWQKYKENIYGPWDEAVVHDSDDIEDCVGISKKSK